MHNTLQALTSNFECLFRMDNSISINIYYECPSQTCTTNLDIHLGGKKLKVDQCSFIPKSLLKSMDFQDSGSWLPVIESPARPLGLLWHLGH